MENNGLWSVAFSIGEDRRPEGISENTVVLLHSFKFQENLTILNVSSIKMEM